MPQHRTNKHKVRKVKPDTKPVNSGDEWLTIKQCKLLANVLIEEGSCKDVERILYVLKEWNNTNVSKTCVILCAMCAEKIGIKKCSRCPRNSEIRYCSRECQVAAWPSHRICCDIRVNSNEFLNSWLNLFLCLVFNLQEVLVSPAVVNVDHTCQ